MGAKRGNFRKKISILAEYTQEFSGGNGADKFPVA
jgi:hypothetical protein